MSKHANDKYHVSRAYVRWFLAVLSLDENVNEMDSSDAQGISEL